LEREQGGNVDDLAGSLGKHVPSGMLHQPEHTAEVHVDDCLPIFFGMFNSRRAPNDTCVVNENVDRAEVANSFLYQPRTHGRIAHVSGQRNAINTNIGNALLSVNWRLRRSVNSHVGSSLGKGHRNGCAEPPRGTRNQRNFALQFEFVEDQGNWSSLSLKLLT